MEWPAQPPNYSLQGNAVDVYCVPFSQSPHPYAQLITVLADDECERAERFVFRQDHVNYVLGRGLLRVLLGRYLQLNPQDIHLVTSEYGKPSLLATQNTLGLHFNLSHAGDYIVFAFTLDQAIGVDIETIRPDFASDEIAERFFSASEYHALSALDKADKPRAFFHTWTCKEAFIKAIGEGLSFPLDQFDVAVDPEADPQILAIRGDAASAQTWALYTWVPVCNCLSAIAIQRFCNDIRVWQMEK